MLIEKREDILKAKDMGYNVIGRIGIFGKLHAFYNRIGFEKLVALKEECLDDEKKYVCECYNLDDLINKKI